MTTRRMSEDEVGVTTQNIVCTLQCQQQVMEKHVFNIKQSLKPSGGELLEIKTRVFSSL